MYAEHWRGMPSITWGMKTIIYRQKPYQNCRFTDRTPFALLLVVKIFRSKKQKQIYTRLQGSVITSGVDNIL